jgi:cyanophycinase
MRRLFLFSNLADNFEAVSTGFVEAAGGSSARIALLLAGGPDWERYVPRYRDPWIHLGAAEVIPIAPLGDDLRLDVSQINQLKRCSGVFIGGGDTRKYQMIYVGTEAGAIIRDLYQLGIPFGGVSAGALISTESCVVRGCKVTTEANEYFVQTKLYYDPLKDGDVQLRLDKGLGLFKGCLIEVHFSELGRFPRLVQAMELTKSIWGLGIDEPICLEVSEGKLVRAHGRGRAYCLKRLGPLRFEVRVLEPGDELELGEA